VVSQIARAAQVRQEAVRKVLSGLEVWPRTYAAVADAARAAGVAGVPPLAERAPRQRPCRECERLRARVAELEAALASDTKAPPKLGVVPAAG
jgi:hypothetical protein